MDLAKFDPKNLQHVRLSDLESLTIDDITLLAKTYPHMDGILLIQRKDGTGIKSPATYRSFVSLIRSGHPFRIVGTKYGEPAPNRQDIQKDVVAINQVEFIEPPAELFAKKRGKKSKIFNQ